ncbi:prolyl aminopeptidase [Ornithinimicrobium cryptoxanthini]|uniref:prolyl aminopeptidase n=1 Tax=Ornithinimicrobium cryptoxanthini TaxID=2934161 RepID=UPI002119456E|nr:prolyl aminopeptidase [Ornithinimicrobium cryptoxanthini]
MPFPAVEPLASELLDLDDGTQLYWEESGNPAGKPIIWLHGGPGSGLGGGGYRRRPDPAVWRIIGIDQRGCGRSRPVVGAPEFDLAALTTERLIRDIEAVREHLGIEQWLVAGGSWGSTLALAYALAHPDRVSAIVLIAVTTTSRAEVSWISESVGRIFPREWEAFELASGRRPGQRLVDAYVERLADPDPAVREAAALAWCTWEDVHMSLAPGPLSPLREEDPAFRLTFATQVTWFWSHSGFLGERGILDRIGEIAHLPAVLIHGRLDVSGPLATAWELHRAWPGSQLIVIEGEGHGGESMAEEQERAYASFARS